MSSPPIREHATTFLFGVALLAIGTGVGVIIQGRRAESESAMRYLDWRGSVSTSLLREPSLQQELEVLFEGTPIQDVSLVTASLFNYSDLDVDELTLYVDVAAATGDSLRPLSLTAVGPGGLIEAVEPLQEFVSEGFADTLHYGFIVRAVNRQDPRVEGTRSPGFHVSLVLDGQASGVEVRILQTGFEAREFDFASLFFRNQVWFDQIFWPLALSVFVLLGVLILWRALQRSTVAGLREQDLLLLEALEGHVESEAAWQAMRTFFDSEWERIRGRWRWTEPEKEPSRREAEVRRPLAAS